MLGVSGDGELEPSWAGWRSGAQRAKDASRSRQPSCGAADFCALTRKRGKGKGEAPNHKKFFFVINDTLKKIFR